MSSEARFRSITYAVGAWITFGVLAHFLPPKFGTVSSGWVQTGILVVLSVVFYFCIQGLVKNSQPKVKTETKTIKEKDYVDKGTTIGMRNDLKTLMRCTTRNVTTDDELRASREAMKRCRTRLRDIERNHVGVEIKYEKSVEEIYD